MFKMDNSDQIFTFKEMAELERRRLVAASLRGTLAALNSDLPIDKLLKYIVNQALPLLSADAAAIYHLRMDGLLSIEALVGLPDEYINFANVPLGRLASGRAVLLKKPVFIKNLSELLNEPDLPPDLLKALEIISNSYRSILSVPIEIREESYGALTLYFTKRHKINDEEIALAKDFSIQAALSIDNARLHLRTQKDAVDIERVFL